MPMRGQPRSRVPDHGRVLGPEAAVFGDQVTEALARTLGTDLVGVYFVGGRWLILIVVAIAQLIVVLNSTT